MITEHSTKCPNCGGTLKKHTFGVLKCLYCDEEYAIEIKDIGKFYKANELRLNKKFAEALELYIEILKEDSNFPEANWGALLSEYGVEYIEEANKSIPTILRPLQNYKITEDTFAINLLNNVYGDDYDFYHDKINELENLRLQIEKASLDYQKFDVFISCKITNPESDIEEKTPEYEWGKLVYQRLSQKGLNVFFSPKTLPSTNGAYEPIIYSALQSARYLIILASKPEYLESTWIKNEWERYLQISSISKSSDRYCKLVIDSSVAKNVPAKLKSVSSHIEHGNTLTWLSNLEKAVLSIFPEYQKAKYDVFSGGFLHVDLNSFKNQKNKKFTPREIYKTGSDNLIMPHNPYSVNYSNLLSEYTLEENVEICTRKVQIHLRNGKFREAKYELQSYLDFVDGSDLDFNILILNMLIISKSTSLENFFEVKIDDFTDYSMFSEIVSKLPADSADDFLVPLSNYIKSSIQNRLVNNSIEYYKLIANIKHELIDKLHENIVRSLPYLFESPKYLIEFADISFPFVASNDIDFYINLASDLADGLSKNSLWDEAEKIAKEVLRADAQNSKCCLIILMVEHHANNYESLLTSIENSGNFYEIEDLIPTLYKTGVQNLVRILKSHINNLILTNEFEKAASWLEIVAVTSFEDRDLFFSSIIETCKNLSNSHKVFSIAIHTLSEDKFDYLINSSIDFITTLIHAGNFAKAREFAKEINEYDLTNSSILNLYLLAELEETSLSYDNIYKLKDMSIIEKILLNQTTDSEREAFLTRLIIACIRYISRDFVSSDDHIFEIFDKLISYFPNLSKNNAGKSKICLFADKCLEKRLFDKAEWYYITLIKLDISYHKAYWGILLSKNNCSNVEELITIPTVINNFPEYTLAIKYSEGDEESENAYSNILSRQMEYRLKRKIPKYIWIAFIALIVIVIITIIVL